MNGFKISILAMVLFSSQAFADQNKFNFWSGKAFRVPCVAGIKICDEHPDEETFGETNAVFAFPDEKFRLYTQEVLIEVALDKLNMALFLKGRTEICLDPKEDGAGPCPEDLLVANGATTTQIRATVGAPEAHGASIIKLRFNKERHSKGGREKIQRIVSHFTVQNDLENGIPDNCGGEGCWVAGINFAHARNLGCRKKGKKDAKDTKDKKDKKDKKSKKHKRDNED